MKNKLKNLNNTRNVILEKIKPYVVKYGWNENLFFDFSKSSDFKYEEIVALFPKGYKTLIQMYLTQINKKMNNDSQKLNLIRLKVHERIRNLVILRLKIILEEKELFSKTFLNLLLPHNYKLASKSLYKVVDEIWFLAGDNSTDFNFYSKRIILSAIYTNIIMHFINNDNLEDTIKILNQQLKAVSHIPKFKNRFKDVSKFLPRIINLGKHFSFIKQ